MELRKTKNAFLHSLGRKGRKKIAKNLMWAQEAKRSPKRASPRPMDRETNRKRRNHLPSGSVESLASSTSSEEDYIDEGSGVAREYEDVLSALTLEKFGEIQFQLDLNNNVEPVSSWNCECTALGTEFSTASKGSSKVECAGPEQADEKVCEIYCHGPLLKAAQDAHMYNDSKSFVDMKMKNDPGLVLDEFETLQNISGCQPTNEQVTNFVNKYFDPPGSEFEKWEPDDWTASPKFLDDIVDPDLKSWAKELNVRWKDLGRKIASDVKTNASRYSMIFSENPIVVPGGRFRESYYWDNYWIVRGLLLSEMHSTVKGSIRNFLAMVEKYGFVPNGGRLYYTRRSQPPFLTLMVRDYVNATGDYDFLNEALPILEKEYNFWMDSRKVDVADADGNAYALNRYASDVNQPRPESYREDAELIAGLSEAAGQELMTHITSACESGWDFSSRWTGSCYGYSSGSGSLLNDLRTRDVVPVDLNSILAAVEKTLEEFYTLQGDNVKANRYASAYQARVEAIENILWNEDDGVYYDYLISQKTHNRQYFASNVNPLWTKCYSESINVQERERKMYKYLQNQGVLEYPGGIPTSLNDSGQQWDFPNAWPPLVHMIIEGMASSSLPELRAESGKQAQKWISSNWRGFNSTTFMFEKYDVTRDDGLPGGGGEYDVQEGFGWTNGVVMSLLKLFGDQLTAEMPVDHPTETVVTTTSGAAASAIAAGSVVLSAAVAGLSNAVL